MSISVKYFSNSVLALCFVWSGLTIAQILGFHSDRGGTDLGFHSSRGGVVSHNLVGMLFQLCGGSFEVGFQHLDITMEGVMNPFGALWMKRQRFYWGSERCIYGCTEMWYCRGLWWAFGGIFLWFYAELFLYVGLYDNADVGTRGRIFVLCDVTYGQDQWRFWWYACIELYASIWNGLINVRYFPCS